ncbi:MAG: class I SAM-dependent methyltransferase [Brachybacterium sp.]|nr:class I SAM-dependent methyltransferase [Brachybacterium sp.]MDN5900014.1 class I SAM-dependent methyltransferase [Brachybacterium sp.]
MNRRHAGQEWDAYLAGFHEKRPGITERLLSRSLDARGATPYDWVAGALSDSGPVVDVACGSAPLWNPRLAGRYLGVDLSSAELDLARQRGAHRLTRGSAEVLPVETGTAATVVCSMALMVLPDLPAALGETRRVLRPGGRFVAIVPTIPRRLDDLVFGAGLVRAARGPLSYRNDPLLRRPRRLFAEQGLTITEDTRRTYRFDLSADGAADAAASFYLRGPQSARESEVAHYLSRASRRGRTMPIPIRRILARLN